MLADVRDFLEAGGLVVEILLFVTIVLWAMILERMSYFRKVMPLEVQRVQEIWNARSDHSSWEAKQIKRMLISTATKQIRGSIPLIKAVVALCPMIGLLGTVTGMIQVFGVMASLGTGNARAMASGVSAATLPTMAGMVIAISGLYSISRFEQIVEQETHKLNDHMITH